MSNQENSLSFFDDFIKEFPKINLKKDLFFSLKKVLFELSYSLNYAILKGDYIKNVDCFEKFEERFLEISVLTQEFRHISDLRNYREIKNYLDFYNYHIAYSQFFESKINRIYSKKSIEYFDKEIALNTQLNLFKNVSFLFSFFTLNIEIAKIDHQFVYEDHLLKDLFRLKNDITNIRLSSKIFEESSLFSRFEVLKKAVLLKVDFLIDKWYIRSMNELKDTTFNIHINSHKSIYNNRGLDRLKDKMIALYELKEFNNREQNNKEVLRKLYYSIDIEPQLDSSLFDLHTFIKYYKDESKDLESLQQLILVFDKKIKYGERTNKNLYEIFALHISKQYCQNNYFSLFCEQFVHSCKNLNAENLGIKLDQLHSTYLSIKGNSTHLTDNFFLEFKFLYYCFNILEDALMSNEYEKVRLIKRTYSFFNEVLKEVLEEYDKKTQWSIKNNNYIFKLPFEESLIEYENVDIYLASSFLLPKMNEDIIYHKRKLELLYQKLNLVYGTRTQLIEIEGLKTDFKSDNKRTIEIVTIFTAVISFIMGSIGGFKFVDNIYNAIAFTLSFGLCLSFFITMVLRLIRKEKYDFLSSNIIVVFFVILLIIATLLLSQQTQITKENLKDELLKLKVDVKC